jgi:hypothetical protein
MKERGILFSGPMVRAILAGAKTVTRRAAKEAPSWATFADTRDGKGIVDWHSADVKPNGAGSFYSSEWAFSVCPYGVPGDRLWVRETHAEYEVDDVQGTRTFFRADYADGACQVRPGVFLKWTPGIHMPRVVSRITLEVVSVRVERLHAITEEEAVREGLPPRLPEGTTLSSNPSAAKRFTSLWETINGAGSWDSNPWVWRVEFKRVTSVEVVR